MTVNRRIAFALIGTKKREQEGGGSILNIVSAEKMGKKRGEGGNCKRSLRWRLSASGSVRSEKTGDERQNGGTHYSPDFE